MKNNALYMHEITGDIQTHAEWRDDFESMDREMWFGTDDCDGLDWLEDVALVEVQS